MLSHSRIRQSVVDACASLVGSGVMSASGHGNFSALAESERMILTPAGMSSPPTREELALVRFDGTVEEGGLAASVADIVSMHAVIYRSRPDAAAIVHTHSPAVTAFAVAHVPLPCRYEALIRHGQTCHAPVAAWGPRGSTASLDAITTALDIAPGTQAVLLANHGLLAFGRNAAAAAALVVVLEEAAAAELAANSLGGGQDLPPGAAARVKEWMDRGRQPGIAGGATP